MVYLIVKNEELSPVHRQYRAILRSATWRKNSMCFHSLKSTSSTW